MRATTATAPITLLYLFMAIYDNYMCKHWLEPSLPDNNDKQPLLLTFNGCAKICAYKYAYIYMDCYVCMHVCMHIYTGV